jgi:uncharacterized Tic20 family protein
MSAEPLLEGARAQAKPDQPADPTSEDRTVAVLAHWSGCVFWFVPPVVLLLLIRPERRSFAAWHLREAVNFELCVFLYIVLATALAFGLVLALLLVFLVLVNEWLILSTLVTPLVVLEAFKTMVVIVASRAAYRGRWFRCPLTVRFIPHPKAL